ncbi:putative thiamine biosynthetic bifunctional enzyme [Hyaloraphidium curvatum]|nr:putative thiamine biosynthetic bifunctional enzyme [Hyaloraphidium curvatum]
MPRPPLDLSVYLVTDSTLVPPGRTLPGVVDEALRGGATIVQLREKNASTRPFIELAREIAALCRARGVPLLINDRVDVALAVGADGVHVGQSDMPLAQARKLLGEDAIIGVTAEDPRQAVEALNAGADYLGTAGVFPTKTKVYDDGGGSIGIEGLKAILSALRDAEHAAGKRPIPIVAIGGIGRDNAAAVLEGAKLAADGDKPERGLAGLAVVSAIVAQPDAKLATEELAAIVRPRLAAGDAVPRGPASPGRSPKAESFVKDVVTLFRAVKEKRPLVHSITNFVVMNDNANVLLAIGASPIMAHSMSEVADIISICSALVINIGTLAEETSPSFLAAGRRANELGLPVVLDPVGAGASPYRQRVSREIVAGVRVGIIKGNAAEVAFLAGSDGPVSRGVDSEGEVAGPEGLVRRLAKESGAAVAMTGPVDHLVAPGGGAVVKLANGNEWLGRITGTGCDTAALCGAFAGAAKGVALEWDANLVAAAGGVLAMGIAAEMAVAQGPVQGPGSFKTALFDALYALTPEILEKMAKVEVVE